MNLWIWVFSGIATGWLVGLFQVTSRQLAGQNNTAAMYLAVRECAFIANGVR